MGGGGGLQGDTSCPYSVNVILLVAEGFKWKLMDNLLKTDVFKLDDVKARFAFTCL